MNFNNLSIEICEPYSLVIKLQAMAEIEGASIQEMTSFFPGGLYGVCSFFVPKEIIRGTGLKGRDRVVLRNGQTTVWEGELTTITFVATMGAREGVLIESIGPCGTLLDRETLDRRWADDRIGSKLWREVTSASAAEFVQYDRNDRIRITPKTELWVINTGARLEYTSPEGETTGRVSGTTELQESGQAWEFIITDNVGGGFASSQRTSSGSGAIDIDHSGTPTRTTKFQYIARAGQTPTSEGTYFCQATNLITYAYKSSNTYGGDPKVDIVAKDLVNEVGDLNSSIKNIDTPASNLTLIPFYTEGRETIAKILLKATSFGDAASNELYAQLQASEKAEAADCKPVLFVKQYPALTSSE